MRGKFSTPFPALTIRLDLDADRHIEPTKIELLEQIHACGSISAAGRAMCMPYKRAWNLVDEINRVCRRLAVARQIGGKNGGGANLTPFGYSLIARYRQIERSAEKVARAELTCLLADLGAGAKA
jgi:molybdate transport system regulatory protein